MILYFIEDLLKYFKNSQFWGGRPPREGALVEGRSDENRQV